MTKSDNTHNKPTRRKSDVTLLGKSSHDLDHKVYTLEFGVNLSELTLEGLNNYSVSISRTDKEKGDTESLATALEVSLKNSAHTIQVEGGPPSSFTVTDKTIDLTIIELDSSIIDAVKKGLEWVKGEGDNEWIYENRRRVPVDLLNDPIAVNLLMSSISTIIGGSVDCHRRIMLEKKAMFSSRQDYIDAMYDGLRVEIDEFTVVAINRGVQNYVANS
jgi:hypothetical protein